MCTFMFSVIEAKGTKIDDYNYFKSSSRLWLHQDNIGSILISAVSLAKLKASQPSPESSMVT